MLRTAEDIRHLNDRIAYAGRFVDAMRAEIGKVIVGQNYMLDRLLIGLLSNGHVLLEGVPGLAKTLTIRSLSEAIQAKFSRIQFTPDLLPADVIGTMIYNQQQNEFVVRKGPIFANFILADEITALPLKCKVRCWKQWPNGRLQSVIQRINSMNRSWCWLRKIR
jgi:MoxR-like ATPase